MKNYFELRKVTNELRKVMKITNELRKSYERVTKSYKKLRKVTKSYKRVTKSYKKLQTSYADDLCDQLWALHRKHGLLIRAPRQPKSKFHFLDSGRLRSSEKPLHREKYTFFNKMTSPHKN